MQQSDQHEHTPESFPCLVDLSPAFLFASVPVSGKSPWPSEVAFVGSSNPEHSDAIAVWNALWEAGPLRSEFLRSPIPEGVARTPFLLREFPKDLLAALTAFTQTDITLVPYAGKGTAYAGYAPILHLLPLARVREFGLPAIESGVWPPVGAFHYFSVQDQIQESLPEALGTAFMCHVWPLLSPNKHVTAFGPRDPLRLLVQNLDYWLPFVDLWTKLRRRKRGRIVEEQAEKTARVALAGLLPEGLSAECPLFGGDLWRGEASAWKATSEIVELADRHGRLRSVVECLGAGSVASDASSAWDDERERVERALFKKDSGTRVAFVEIPDAAACHGPGAEVRDGRIWHNALSVLDRTQNTVIVCLGSAATENPEFTFGDQQGGCAGVTASIGELVRQASILLGVTPGSEVRQSEFDIEVERGYRDHQYRTRAKLELIGRSDRKSNTVILNGQRRNPGDAEFKFLMFLVRELLKGRGGWVSFDDVKPSPPPQQKKTKEEEKKGKKGKKMKGIIPEDHNNAVLRLRKALDGVQGLDRNDLIETPHDGRVRLSTHPRFVGYNREALVRHPDSEIKKLAKGLAKNA